MDEKWTAITIIVCCLIVVAGIAHVIATIILVRRYRWPFWLSLNFAAFVLSLPIIKAVIKFWGSEIEINTFSGTWTAIIVVLALSFGYLLQAKVIRAEQRVIEPDFQESLATISRALEKGRDPWDCGRLHGIPKDTVQAAIHCFSSVKLGAND